MKGELIACNCKVLNLEQRATQDNSIQWVEITYLQGTNCNTLTISKEAASKCKVGSVQDLVILSQEVAKAYKNGNGAYLETKFKVVDVIKE